jgi:3-carboxy-cis,cis-muconate cycloisomerase
MRLTIVELERARAACRELAERHRDDLMLARTLLQPAVPTTFGLKVAGWLSGLTAGRRRLAEVATHGPAVQLGGPAGTFGALDERGGAVRRRMGERLGLAVPVLPWHTQRVRVAEMGAALAVVAGTLEKVALDIELLAQAEVAEVALQSTGGSSAMPNKQNPVGCVVVRADAATVRAAAGVLFAGMAQEHERGAGPWHAEWHALRDALGFSVGAAAELAGVLEGLHVDPVRMRANLDAQRGLPMATYAAAELTSSLGRLEAHALVRDASRRASDEDRELVEVLAELLGELPAVEAAERPSCDLATVLDPARLVPGLRSLVDQALAAEDGDG